MNICPEFSLLSQFLDDELGEMQGKEIYQHIETCPECRTRIVQVESAENKLRAVFDEPTAQLWTDAFTPACLSPEQISDYVHEALSDQTNVKAEQHLQICDLCLTEVQKAFHHNFFLTSTERRAVPPALQARVTALWNRSPEQERSPLSRLVIHIARKSLQLIEQRVVAPIRDVEELFVPLPVYRAEGKASILNLKIPVDQAEIRATIAGGEHGVELQMTLLNAEQEALVGQRIFLRQHGRAVFSAKTDDAGILRTPTLQPGIYEVSCPGITAVFQLELQT